MFRSFDSNIQQDEAHIVIDVMFNIFGNAAKKMNVSEMRRGMGGRLEEAFAAAKESGKAAFVSFVTAGYPAAEGELTAFEAFRFSS